MHQYIVPCVCDDGLNKALYERATHLLTVGHSLVGTRHYMKVIVFDM